MPGRNPRREVCLGPSRHLIALRRALTISQPSQALLKLGSTRSFHLRHLRSQRLPTILNVVWLLLLVRAMEGLLIVGQALLHPSKRLAGFVAKEPSC